MIKHILSVFIFMFGLPSWAYDIECTVVKTELSTSTTTELLKKGIVRTIDQQKVPVVIDGDLIIEAYSEKLKLDTYITEAVVSVSAAEPSHGTFAAKLIPPTDATLFTFKDRRFDVMYFLSCTGLDVI